jgi:hypothetical protein
MSETEPPGPASPLVAALRVPPVPSVEREIERARIRARWWPDSAEETPEPSVAVSVLRRTMAYWEQRGTAPKTALAGVIHDTRSDCDEAERTHGGSDE